MERLDEGVKVQICSYFRISSLREHQIHALEKTLIEKNVTIWASISVFISSIFLVELDILSSLLTHVLHINKFTGAPVWKTYLYSLSNLIIKSLNVFASLLPFSFLLSWQQQMQMVCRFSIVLKDNFLGVEGIGEAILSTITISTTMPFHFQIKQNTQKMSTAIYPLL